MSHPSIRPYGTRSATATAAFVFLSAAALYLSTAGPTLGGGFDSAEFQQVAYTLGIAHPTGYPLYLILGKIFTSVVPVGNVAYRMNVLSALLGAGGALFFYLNARFLTGRLLPALAATAIYATNVGVWRQSGVASNYPLNLLLIGALVYALLLWSEGRVPLAIPGLLFGLGLAHHRSIIVLLPCIVLLLVFTRSKRPPAREWWVAASATLAPLLLYLYLPAFGNSSPWYSNTLEGFISYVTGEGAGSYIRLTPGELAGAVADLSPFLFGSFSLLGLALIVLGAISVLPRSNRWKTVLRLQPSVLFLGLATVLMTAFAVFFDSEQDRYFSLPFLFLALWFAVGAGAVEILLECRISGMWRRASARFALGLALALVVLAPFRDHYQEANWSSYDREYKQADEIFTLPLPRGAVIVGDWRQLNGMRYMQRVEQRRPDLAFVGSQFEIEPQTRAAQDAFANGRSLFLAPGVAVPTGSFRYAMLGPLLEVRDTPQMFAPETAKPTVAVTTASALADYGITTALEPFAPTTNVAPTRSVRVGLVWHAEARLRDFLVRLRLYDPEQRLISQKDEAPVRGLYPPSRWEKGEYVSDVKNLLIPAGTPPGSYVVKMTILDSDTRAPASEEITLGAFVVDSLTDVPRDQIFVQHSAEIALDRRIGVGGYGGLDNARHPGEVFSFYLVWSVHESLGSALQLHIALLDASGKAVTGWTRAPLEFYPTERWQAGEWLKAYYDVEIPKDLPPGKYSFGISFDQQPMQAITQIQIAP